MSTPDGFSATVAKEAASRKSKTSARKREKKGSGRFARAALRANCTASSHQMHMCAAPTYTHPPGERERERESERERERERERGAHTHTHTHTMQPMPHKKVKCYWLQLRRVANSGLLLHQVSPDQCRCPGPWPHLPRPPPAMAKPSRSRAQARAFLPRLAPKAFEQYS